MIAYRQCHPAHAQVSDATLRASAREGGRFNPRHEFGALYVSLSRKTAVDELRRRARRLAVDLAELLPRTMLRLRVDLERVLDLTDPSVAAAWGLSAAQLRSDDLAPCQEVARTARRAGYEAIRFPAASGTGENVAIFLDRLHAGSTVVVESAEELML
ncbi:MAG: RES family NAD+ phosphorylase [Gammaproteobacteria bacterium]|nr:RES family NAD+ phosphorylase [Gammaproteobacteria bacterium]